MRRCTPPLVQRQVQLNLVVLVRMNDRVQRDPQDHAIHFLEDALAARNFPFRVAGLGGDRPLRNDRAESAGIQMGARVTLPDGEHRTRRGNFAEVSFAV